LATVVFALRKERNIPYLLERFKKNHGCGQLACCTPERLTLPVEISGVPATVLLKLSRK